MRVARAAHPWEELAILFKAEGGGARIRETLKPPRGVLLQFQDRGSYREQDVVEYLVSFQNYSDAFLPNALRRFFSKLEAPNDRGSYLQVRLPDITGS